AFEAMRILKFGAAKASETYSRGGEMSTLNFAPPSGRRREKHLRMVTREGRVLFRAGARVRAALSPVGRGRRADDEAVGHGRDGYRHADPGRAVLVVLDEEEEARRDVEEEEDGAEDDEAEDAREELADARDARG